MTRVPDPDCSHRTRTNRRVVAVTDLSGNLIVVGEVGPVTLEGDVFSFPITPLPETNAESPQDPS